MDIRPDPHVVDMASVGALSRTLDQIYAVSDSIEAWPALIDSLLAWADILARTHAETDSNDDAFRANEQQIMSWLVPHVTRVFQREAEATQQKEVQVFQTTLLESHPVSMGLCDINGQILWANGAMRTLLAEVPSSRLRQAVDLQTPRPVQIECRVQGVWRRLLAIDVPALGPTRVALLAAGPGSHALDTALLKTLFQLTDAEAVVARMLAKGDSLELIAEHQGTSIHTVRSQTKALMSKLDARRQGEAIVTLLQSPASIDMSVARPVVLPSIQTVRRVQLQGRQVAYAEYGPADGQPVLFAHSWAGCHRQAPRDLSMLDRLGLRLIIPDRPGMGFSDMHADAGLSSGISMMAELLDVLNLPRVKVLAYSMGAAYAIGLAHAHPDKIEHLYLASPLAPLRGWRDLGGIIPAARMVLGMAMLAPAILQPLLRLWLAQMRRNPDLYLESTLPHLPEVDRQAMAAPEMLPYYTHVFVEAIRQGDEGLLADLRVMISDWSHLLDIQVPTDVWHGSLDGHVPWQHAERLVSSLPQACLHRHEGAGHYLIFYLWEQIFKTIAETPPHG